MEKYKFILDGTTLTRNPENWKDIQVTLERQKDIEGLLLIFTSNLTFVKDGYDLLKTQFDQNYNNKITANIDRLDNNNVYVRLFTGVILLSDIKFNLNKKTATVKIEDVSFFGAINANKNIKTFLNSEFTKNSVQITTPTTFQLDYFEPASALPTFFGFGNRDHYLISDALDFLVRFMTDNEVKGITSTYLSDTTNFEGGLLYIITGEEIRTGTGLHPNVSFKQLFQFLQRTHNISFVIEEDSNGDPVMRIEEKAFFFASTTSFSVRDIKDLELTVDKQKIFSHLEVGNKTFEKSGQFSSTTRFFSFRDEDYSLEGKANVDKLLDFKTDFITDSNVIENLLMVLMPATDDEFDEDVFIVTGNAALNQVIPFPSPRWHYNKGLTNDKIILRQINSIPNSIVKHLTTETTPCKIFKINTTFKSGFGIGSFPYFEPTSPINFTDELYDLGSNFNNAAPNFNYEIPFNGDFSFFTGILFSIELIRIDTSKNFGFIAIQNTVRLQRWNSDRTNLIEQKTKILPQVVIPFTFTLPLFALQSANISHTFTDASNGDKIQVVASGQIQAITNGMQAKLGLLTSSVFTCIGAANDAGVYQVFDPADFRALVYKFRKNTNFTNFNTLRSQSLRRILFNEGSDPTLDKTAWIDKIDYKVETSETNYQLIT